MLIFCLLALVAGGVLSTVAPVSQFSIGLVVLTIGGALQSYWMGTTPTQTFVWAFALFASAQVGYAVGAAVRVYFEVRRAQNAAAGDAKKDALSELTKSVAKLRSRIDS
jgi:hypothetical protein